MYVELMMLEFIFLYEAFPLKYTHTCICTFIVKNRTVKSDGCIFQYATVDTSRNITSLPYFSKSTLFVTYFSKSALFVNYMHAI